MTDADDNSTLAAICDSHLFKSLDDQGRLQLLAGATSESYASGVVIVREEILATRCISSSADGLRSTRPRRGRPFIWPSSVVGPVLAKSPCSAGVRAPRR